MLPIICIFHRSQDFQILVYSVKPSLTGLTPGSFSAEFVYVIPNVLTYPLAAICTASSPQIFSFGTIYKKLLKFGLLKTAFDYFIFFIFVFLDFEFNTSLCIFRIAFSLEY